MLFLEFKPIILCVYVNFSSVVLMVTQLSLYSVELHAYKKFICNLAFI